MAPSRLILPVILLLSCAADAAPQTCRYAFNYRLDDSWQERGGWIAKSGQITVETDPYLFIQGGWGMTVCAAGETNIRFFSVSHSQPH
jgi:hypothetical protein